MSADQLPNGWARVKFGDVVRKVNVRVDPPTAGIDRYVAGEHMDTDDLTIRRWGEVGDGYLGPAFHMRFKPGQVLYGSRRTYLRKVAVADFEGICANTTFVLEPSSEELLPEFLPHVMTTEAFHGHSIRQSKGSVNPYINFSDLTWYEFALPPIEEQQRIAEVIGAADRCVSELSCVEVRTDKLVDALAGTLDSHAIGHASLAEVADVTVGIVVKPADLYVSGGGVPALRSLNVAPGRLVWDDVVSISEEGHVAHAKSRLSSGDVVIVRSGRPGDAAVIPDGLAELNAIDLLIARCRAGAGITPDLLVTYLNSSSGRRQMLGRSAGTAQQHLNAGQLKQVQVPQLPALDQERVREQMNAVGRVRQTALKKLADARKFRASLLENCMKGPGNVQ